MAAWTEEQRRAWPPCTATYKFHCNQGTPLRTDESGQQFSCYFYGDVPQYVPFESINRCLKPPPTPPGQSRQRVMFLVGDSHCASVSLAFERAVSGHMQLVTACKMGTWFLPMGDDEDNWVEAVLNGLSAVSQPGDVVAIAQHGAINYNDFLDVLMVGILRPKGVSLVLVGDPPLITQPANICEPAPELCEISPMAMDRYDVTGLRPEFVGITRADMEQRLQSYAADQPDVYVLSIAHLFTEGAPGEHLMGNIPGTSQRAYFDNAHLLMAVGGQYLWPYLCSQLREWGFFN